MISCRELTPLAFWSQLLALYCVSANCKMFICPFEIVNVWLPKWSNIMTQRLRIKNCEMLFCPADKVELTSNGLENSRWGVARHPPPPSSPSGRSPAASSSSSSPSPGQDALGLAAPSEPTPNTTSGAEQTNSSTTESATDSLPAG